MSSVRVSLSSQCLKDWSTRARHLPAKIRISCAITHAVASSPVHRTGVLHYYVHTRLTVKIFKNAIACNQQNPILLRHRSLLILCLADHSPMFMGCTILPFAAESYCANQLSVIMNSNQANKLTPMLLVKAVPPIHFDGFSGHLCLHHKVMSTLLLHDTMHITTHEAGQSHPNHLPMQHHLEVYFRTPA